jgi:glutaredoxin
MVGRVTKKTNRFCNFVKKLDEVAVNKGYKNAEDLKNISLTTPTIFLDGNAKRIL